MRRGVIGVSCTFLLLMASCSSEGYNSYREKSAVKPYRGGYIPSPPGKGRKFCTFLYVKKQEKRKSIELCNIRDETVQYRVTFANRSSAVGEIKPHECIVISIPPEVLHSQPRIYIKIEAHSSKEKNCKQVLNYIWEEQDE